MLEKLTRPIKLGIASLGLIGLIGCSDNKFRVIGVVKERQQPTQISSYPIYAVPMTVDVINFVDKNHSKTEDTSQETYPLILYVNRFVPTIAEGDTITFETKDVTRRRYIGEYKYSIKPGTIKGELVSINRH